MSKIITTQTPMGIFTGKSQCFNAAMTGTKSRLSGGIDPSAPAVFSPQNLKFPRISGFDTNNELTFMAHWIHERTAEVDPNEYLKVSTYAANLGDIHLSYILDNMPVYVLLYESVADDYSHFTPELIASKALMRLYSINIYNKRQGLDYNLPKVLYKRIKSLERMINDYYNTIYSVK